MLQNKTVVVTGAGRGIGRTLALGFAAEGAHVLIHYAHAHQEAREVVQEITKLGGKALLLQADLSQPEDAARLVKESYELLGPIDTWINNAGASANSKETRGMDEVEIFDRIMVVDVRGTWLCCRAVKPYIREGGCIITIGWDGAFTGEPGFVNQLYALSKGAIISLTRCLAAEFAPGVRVNCIAPGYTENEWSRQLSTATQQRIAERIPLKRWGTADDILGTALFLASPAATYITGQIILVNGGRVMH